MDRDARLLRRFQIGLVVGGAMAVFAVLDVVLGVTGTYPWSSAASAITRLGIAVVVALVAFESARRAWRQRLDRDLGGVTFADLVMVVGFMVVGGVLLLGLLR